MSFEHPELVFLLVPAFWLWWRHLRRPSALGTLRALLLLLAILTLAGPRSTGAGGGVDLLLVLDRTASMPGESARDQEDVLRRLEEKLGAGDRLGVVTFGDRVRVESPVRAERERRALEQAPGGEGALLTEALETALTLAEPSRATRILVLSDGRHPGDRSGAAAHEAARQGIPIDYLAQPRPPGRDLAVVRIEPPLRAWIDRPFAFSVELMSDTPSEDVPYRLRRGEEILAEGRVDLPRGRTRLAFRDVIERAGLSSYVFELLTESDTDLGNNRAAALVHVLEPSRALVLQGPRTGDAIPDALQGSGWLVDVDQPTPGEWTAEKLYRYRAVVLLDVSMNRLGRTSAEAIAGAVEDLGTGLVIGGGGESYQSGGYVSSPIEPLLPVSLRPREQERRSRVAIVIVLDRSGSMSLPLPSGETKMQLANRGAEAIIELLSPSDEVGVVAVDSLPHVVLPLSEARDPEGMKTNIRRLQSSGGGIFVGVGLQKAWELLQETSARARHILLFADASDSEQPLDYSSYLAEWTAAGLTVSVIGLGEQSDSDAWLLQDIAARGGGRVDFTMDPMDLPRLFAQDAMEVLTSSYVIEPHDVRVSSGTLLQIGDIDAATPPAAGAHHRTTPLEGAQIGWSTAEEDSVPLLAFWSHGRGRVVALPFPLDGPDTGPIGEWDGLADSVRACVDWSSARLVDDVAVFSRRRDDGFEIEVEVADPTSAAPRLIVAGVDGRAAESLELEPSGPGAFRARVSVDDSAPRLTSIALPDGSSVRGPALVRPYSVEHRPEADARAGRRELERIARITGGAERLDLDQALEPPNSSLASDSWRPWLAGALLVLLLLEILEWRTGLVSWSLPSFLARAGRASRRTIERAKTAARERSERARKRPSRKRAREEPAEPSPSDARMETKERQEEPKPGEPEPRPTLGDALRRAKRG